jgi:hypothetical protein
VVVVINRNAEPVIYAEPPPDEGYLGGDQEFYTSKRKAPISDDENDEDYGGKFLSLPWCSCAAGC